MKKFTLIFFIITIISCKDKKVKTTKNEPVISEKEIIEETTEIVKVVTAKSGLNYRDKPKGKVIGKFKFNTKVTVIQHTGITQEITNDGKQISGEWVGVKHHQKKVYVFDGYLSEPKKEILYKETVNPIDVAMLQAYIIRPGKYHNEEIPDEMTTENWFGIFTENGNYSIEKTPITISKARNEVLNNTVKKISANNAKNCYLLINNALHVTERNIDTINTKPMVIHPQKPYSFQFNNIDYTLSSTAKDYEPLNLNINYFKAEGYKLYLEKTENGITTKQLLLFEKYFDDQMVQILFIGDIDGDTIPDLLIDSSNHHNKTVPTLYLSKEAKKEEILKIVSLHKSVGF